MTFSLKQNTSFWRGNTSVLPGVCRVKEVSYSDASLSFTVVWKVSSLLSVTDGVTGVALKSKDITRLSSTKKVYSTYHLGFVLLADKASGGFHSLLEVKCLERDSRTRQRTDTQRQRQWKANRQTEKQSEYIDSISAHLTVVLMRGPGVWGQVSDILAAHWKSLSGARCGDRCAETRLRLPRFPLMPLSDYIYTYSCSGTSFCLFDYEF